MPSAYWEHELYGELLRRADRWMERLEDTDGDEPDDREDRLLEWSEDDES